MSREMVDRVFPKLDDLIDIHLTFLRSLVHAQKHSMDKSIEEIGHILLEQVPILLCLLYSLKLPDFT